MQAIIALGANLGDPISTLQQAISEIEALPKVKLLLLSSFYRTKPVGYDEQDDFINAVMIVETELEPLELYEHLAALELKHHRVRLIKNGPRTLDLDVIAMEQYKSSDPRLLLPHPRAQERAFVLVPLCEIAPDYLFPDTKRSAQDALSLLSPSDLEGVERLDI